MTSKLAEFEHENSANPIVEADLLTGRFADGSGRKASLRSFTIEPGKSHGYCKKFEQRADVKEPVLCSLRCKATVPLLACWMCRERC